MADDKAGFGGTVTDMGSSKAKGMEKKSDGFFGTALDMGAKDAEGVGDGK